MTDILDIAPLAVHTIHPRNPHVEVLLFGRCSGRMNWKIDDEKGRKALGAVLAERGIHEVFSPHPNFSGRVCEPDDLTMIVPLYVAGDHRYLAHRGADADGTVMRGRGAWFVASGDCPTTIVLDPHTGLMIPAHCGRECLYDKAALNGGVPRAHASVVDAMMAHFPIQIRGRLKAFITCGIAARNFRHPITDQATGLTNAKMIAHLALAHPACLEGARSNGCLNLREVIVSQLVRHGMSTSHIGLDTIDTYEDNVKGDYLWHSNRRAAELGATEEQPMRNGVLVINHG